MGILDQLPALIGVIVGAVGSYAAVSRTDKVRWQRARAERWDEKRFDIYMNYANVLKQQARIAVRIGAGLGLDHHAQPLSPEPGLELLAEAESNRTAQWEAVLLVGEASTIHAAREWHQVIWVLELFARGEREDPDVWKRTLLESGIARERFYACARSELGIEGRLPDYEPWHPPAP